MVPNTLANSFDGHQTEKIITYIMVKQIQLEVSPMQITVL